MTEMVCAMDLEQHDLERLIALFLVRMKDKHWDLLQAEGEITFEQWRWYRKINGKKGRGVAWWLEQIKENKKLGDAVLKHFEYLLDNMVDPRMQSNAIPHGDTLLGDGFSLG